MTLRSGPVQSFSPDDRMEAPAAIAGLLIAQGPQGLALVFEGDRLSLGVAVHLDDWPELRARVEKLIAEYQRSQ